MKPPMEFVVSGYGCIWAIVGGRAEVGLKRLKSDSHSHCFFPFVRCSNGVWTAFAVSSSPERTPDSLGNSPARGVMPRRVCFIQPAHHRRRSPRISPEMLVSEGFSNSANGAAPELSTASDFPRISWTGLCHDPHLKRAFVWVSAYESPKADHRSCSICTGIRCRRCRRGGGSAADGRGQRFDASRR